jgi:F-type H+-transporting ATPase subunit delta
MATYEDKALAVASVYSDALLQLAEESGQADRVLEEIVGIASLMEKDADLASFLSSPTVEAVTRHRVIEKVFRGRVSDLLVDALQILAKRERLAILGAAAHTYRAAHERLRGVAEVDVCTATPLTAEYRSRIAELAAKSCGKKVAVNERIDPRVIGGLIVRIGDRKFDMSVAAGLRAVGRRLLERASTEIHRGSLAVEGV